MPYLHDFSGIVPPNSILKITTFHFPNGICSYLKNFRGQASGPTVRIMVGMATSRFRMAPVLVSAKAEPEKRDTLCCCHPVEGGTEFKSLDLIGIC